MRIAIGSDHAGYQLKVFVVELLTAAGHDVVDFGSHSTEPVDYPPICAAVARAVAAGDADRGVVIGGSGQGEQMTANKVRGVRAALCNDLYTARYSRLHNDANVLAMGARVVGTGLAEAIIDVWLSTEFEGGRHQRRVEQIMSIENGEIPA
ncbi:MAG TPA: ribose 5-phosphate isomerase B [Acidimicrobiales bacterium]